MARQDRRLPKLSARVNVARVNAMRVGYVTQSPQPAPGDCAGAGKTFLPAATDPLPDEATYVLEVFE